MNPIITTHQEIVIENSVRYIELLKSEATKILDEYWVTWKARNQLISQTTYANGGKFMPGRFAPVFKKVGSSQKLTIVWKDFSPRFKKKLNIMAWLLNLNSEDTALVVLKMPWTGNWR